MEEEKKKTNTRKSTNSTKKKATTKVTKEVKEKELKKDIENTEEDLKKELEKEENILREELEDIVEPNNDYNFDKEVELTKDSSEENESVVKENGKFGAGEVIIVMILALILGLVLGGFVVSTRMLVKENTSGRRSKNVGDINEVYDNIMNEYYGKEVDKGLVVDNGIAGMLAALGDRYAEYIPTKSTKDYDEYINGEFVGIGIEIFQEELNSPVVLKVFPGGPCDKAGIKVDDVLLRVNGEEIQGRQMNEVTSKIKVNRPGTKLNIVVLRDGEELSFDLNRELVVQPTVTVEYDEKVAIVKIDNFTKHTPGEVEKAYKEIKEKGSKSLILDLRNNAGGDVEAAKKVAEMFLDKDSAIYKFESKKEKGDVKSSTKKMINLDTVIIVNEGTALGSEILATSLRDNLGFKVIGHNTYGYGVLRKQFVLSDGSYLFIPNSKWLTKNGLSIDGEGIKPDEEVEEDKVLERAKELFNNKI